MRSALRDSAAGAELGSADDDLSPIAIDRCEISVSSSKVALLLLGAVEDDRNLEYSSTVLSMSSGTEKTCITRNNLCYISFKF